MKEMLVPSSDVCAAYTASIVPSEIENERTASTSALDGIATFNTPISSAATDADKDESKFTSASDAEVKDATAAPVSVCSFTV